MTMLRDRPLPQRIDILIVDDDEGDVLLTRRALVTDDILVNARVAKDGVEAIDYLRSARGAGRPTRPDLILLDLNMPRKDGREVLAEIKQDAGLRSIPVVVWTTSDSDEDALSTYNLHANCFVTKPVDLEQYKTLVQAIKSFWSSAVKLPPK